METHNTLIRKNTAGETSNPANNSRKQRTETLSRLDKKFPGFYWNQIIKCKFPSLLVPPSVISIQAFNFSCSPNTKQHLNTFFETALKNNLLFLATILINSEESPWVLCFTLWDKRYFARTANSSMPYAALPDEWPLFFYNPLTRILYRKFN